MECDYRGAPAVGREVLRRYFEISRDRPPPALLGFYKSYRACVRAKVLVLRAQHPAAARRRDLSLAEEYLDLADGYARNLGPPWVLIVRGLTGSGKSTLAGALAKTLGPEWIPSDAVRRDLFGLEAPQSEFGQGTCRSDNRARVYDEMLARADKLLQDGLSLVLDATFLANSHLQAAVERSRRRAAVPVIIECHCPDEVALERIQARTQQGPSLSEATEDVHRHQQRHWEPVPTGVPVCRIDTTTGLAAMLDEVFQYLRRLV